MTIIVKALILGVLLMGIVSLVTADISISENFHPTGKIGDASDISIKNIDNYSQINYAQSKGGNSWAGIYWQYPANNWGNNPGMDLSGASYLSFSVRAESDNEVAEFLVGGTKGTYSDTIWPALSTGKIPLRKEWETYRIDLTGEDLKSVIVGFGMKIWGDKPRQHSIDLKDMKFVY